MKNIHDLPTPAILIDVDRLERNLIRMQQACDANGVELWPHVKTHKCKSILGRQLFHGAAGITCAKIGEAEALLPTGVKRVFIAHSLVDPKVAPRLRALADQLDQLLLAVTSIVQAERLESIARLAGLRVPVLVALDTGLGREGARTVDEIALIFKRLENSNWLRAVGIYTHEGNCYHASPSELDAMVDGVHEKLLEVSQAVGAFGLAPGCSASAQRMAGKMGVTMLRPGAYCLGDLNLACQLPIIPWDDVAITVLATVVDRPEEDLALIDAGSKTFSSDKSTAKETGREWTRPELIVTNVNEEHGYLRGDAAQYLRVGERLRFIPAHACPVMNLTKHVFAVSGEQILEQWDIEARGMVT